MATFEDRSHLYVCPDGFVDVAKLIAAYSPEEHAGRADAYVKSIVDPWSYQMRKPFHALYDTEESRVALAGLSAILSIARIRAGDVVVDFGCGTGWLTIALALMRCRSIGLDVSGEALRLARECAAANPALSAAPPRYELTGEVLPLADGSVDRIICFDAFHHLRDPHGALAEFARVLRPGGLALFHEPGPGNSLSESGQNQMREFAVIEGDVVIETLWPAAQSAGFTELKMAVFTERPMEMDWASFGTHLEGRASAESHEALGRFVMDQNRDKRVFSLRTRGDESLRPENDSRARGKLGGTVQILGRVSKVDSGGVRLKVSAANNGEAWWLPSGGDWGCVNLAPRVVRGDGQTVELARVPLSDTPVLPGQSRTVDALVKLPDEIGPGDSLHMDLVSEWVSWFQEVGSPGAQTPALAPSGETGWRNRIRRLLS